jgi:lysozyme
MSDPAVPICMARLYGEEGKRPKAYNDATGATVSCQPGGNLTIWVGINLEVGLDQVEGDFLLTHRLGLVAAALAAFSWYTGLDPMRASVFLDLGFNGGVHGLMQWPHLLAAAQLKDYQGMHDALLDSSAARALPTRYGPLATLLQTGGGT